MIDEELIETSEDNIKELNKIILEKDYEHYEL